MIKAVNNDIIITEEFKNILNNIEKDNHSVIVLAGPRQCGKTTLLKEYENLENRKNHLVFMVDFRNYHIGSMTQKEREIHIELILCKQLLRQFRATTYLDEKKEIQRLIFQVKRKTVSFYDYINMGPYSKPNNLEIIPTKGNLISEIVKEIKKSGIRKVILEVDRFDWIGESSKYYQKEILSYRYIFDKIIVTSDDEDIFKYEDKFLEKGINILEIEYSKNINSTKKILKEKLKQYNYISINVQKLFNPDIYNYFIDLCNGNFEVMFSIVSNLNSIKNYLSDKEVKEYVEFETHRKKNIYKLIKKKKFHFDS